MALNRRPTTIYEELFFSFFSFADNLPCVSSQKMDELNASLIVMLVCAIQVPFSQRKPRERMIHTSLDLSLRCDFRSIWGFAVALSSGRLSVIVEVVKRGLPSVKKEGVSSNYASNRIRTQ